MTRLTMKHHDHLTIPALLLCLVATLRALAAEADFAGEWEATFGRLALKVDGKVAVGTYCETGGSVNDLKGAIDDGKLTFTRHHQGYGGENLGVTLGGWLMKSGRLPTRSDAQPHAARSLALNLEHDP